MSLELAAKHIASQGRGPDSMLVHMAPREVAGLQALARAHGGSLTVNPTTGLPEAGFLSNILPMIAGAALAPFTGGLSAALLVGGGYGLASGSLMKGITAGLGAFGGAGLAEGLVGLGGSTALAPEAISTAAKAADPIAEIAAAKDAATAAGAVAPTGYDALSSGFQQAVNNPSALANQMGGWSNVAKSGMMAAAPVLADMAVPTATPMPGGSGPNPFRYVYHRGATNPTPQPDPLGREQQYYAPSYERVDPVTGGPYKAPGMAEGGPVMPDPQGIERRYATPTYTQTRAPEMQQSGSGFGDGPLARLLRQINGDQAQPAYAYTYNPGMAYGGTVSDMSERNAAQTLMANGGQMLAMGGVSHLGDYSDGGRLLRGPGDGVSDDIPATIEDKRPARLADGEFVVPARIVSELGNGSTDAGARKLYAMMDRVQAARNKTVGKDKVAVDSKAEKLLPA